MRRAAALLGIVLAASPVAAQDYDGYFSSLFLVMPDVDASAGRQTVAELRTRLFAEGLFNPSERLHLRLGAYVDTLIGRRQPGGGGVSATTAIVRPGDLFGEFRGSRLELRAGMSRVAWGRLDEFQPTDVVNPIDLTRFLLEGRSEARLPVGLVRARVFLPRATTLEGIVVPAFRAGRFDQLDEDSSPFRLSPNVRLERHEPGVSWRSLQGGARVTSTLGRVDWGVSVWRGFEAFPRYTAAPVPVEPLALYAPAVIESFPGFTMAGADFETVRGPWGVRGELAWFEGPSPRLFEGGIGVDRRAGDYRVATNAVVSHADDDTEVTLVGWAERSFARETRRGRLLAVYDPADDTAFVRGIGAVSLRDNLWIEASAGWFAGTAPVEGNATGIDVLSLLARRDFLYARLVAYF